MNIDEWLEHWYPQIVKELSLDPSKDVEAAELASKLIEGYTKTEPEFAPGFTCFVFGAGPSLTKQLENISKLREKKSLWFAADGAARALLQFGCPRPDAVVTDLDGLSLEEILRMTDTTFFVHAHGDNIPLIERALPEMVSRGFRVVPTCQCRPMGAVKNYFGFTDGDRAAWICRGLGAERIVLVGMDFGSEPGAFSKPSGAVVDLRRKALKLNIGERLVRRLAQEMEVVSLEGSKRIDGIKQVPLDAL
ncbi:MAG: 6-hydroxymethylpterin diphosphokinase MptE-like protein [Thermoprotei archaeon]